MTHKTSTLGIIALSQYNEAKINMSKESLDCLVNALLDDGAKTSLCGINEPTIERQSKIVSQWIDLMSPVPSAWAGILDSFFCLFPKSKGLLSYSHIRLIAAIKHIQPNNLTVCGRMLNSGLELWLICNAKDYSILDRSSIIINEYFDVYKEEVHCVFVEMKQISADNLPEFVFKL